MGSVSTVKGNAIVKDGNAKCIKAFEGLAVVAGSTDPPLLEKTIAEQLDEICQQFSDRIAVKTSRCRLTYRELHKKSDALAFGLSNLGIVPGDRVAISLGNCAEYAVIAYACFNIGAIVVPLNPAYTSDQVISALNHISATLFVLSTEITLPYKKPVSTAPLLSSIWKGNLSEKVPSLKKIILVNNTTLPITALDPIFTNMHHYENLILSSKHGISPHRPVRNTDTATIQFTSGTTSTPKAACLSHRNILNNALLVGRGMCLTQEDIICCPPPLYHCFGLVLGLLTAMTYGACVLLPCEAFNTQAVLQSIVEDRPTALYGVPTMFLAELELLSQSTYKDHDFSHVRTGVIGGSPIPSSLREQLHQTLNLTDLASCYGLTESSPIVCMTVPSDSIDRKLYTVGQVLPHTSIKIAARDDPTRTLKRGEKGELLISGYCVMDGYWGDEEWTSKTLIEDASIGSEGEGDGGGKRKWLKSGDEAMIDEEGYIMITGRIKDIIIRGGENIYPPEIENVLLLHPRLSNVSVVGLPDERYGEVIAAFVVVKDGIGEDSNLNDNTIDEGEVRIWVRDRLNKMLVPKFMFCVERMPLTASGKIEKYKLKELGVRLMHQRRQ